MHPNGDMTFLENGARLSRLARQASSLVHEREGDFLALGESLAEFRRRADALADLAGALASLASEGGASAAARELTEELNQLSDLVGVSASERSLEDLDHILGVARELDGLLGNFRRIVRNLQMLGVSTRIESARLDSAGLGFSTLADDVDALAANIVSHSGQITEKCDRLKNLVVEAKSSAVGVMESLRGCSEGIFSSLRENIGALGGFVQTAGSLSGVLGSAARDIGRGVGSIVASLQFHDIVRQQVEHVEHALAEAADMAGDLGSEGDVNQREVIGWIGDVCQLQASQMRNAQDSFHSAIERVVNELRGVAGHVARLGDDVEGLVGGSRGASPLARVEQAVGVVNEAMGDFSHQGGAIAEIMNHVAVTIAEMGNFVVDIEDVGAEIKLIALNASVKAARTGEQGRALGVLAMAIQRLSTEAREQTKAVSDALREISRLADLLRQNAAVHLDAARTKVISERQTALVASLRVTDEALRGKFEAIRRESDALAEEVARTADGIDFHVTAGTAMKEAAAALDAIAVQARRIVPADQDQGRSERLKEMLGRYTMEVERLVHQKALGGDVPASGGKHGGPVEESLVDQGEATEFGDNVELF